MTAGSELDNVERRIVTVLFADLVSFTALSERFDPEDVAIIQDRYFAAVRETVGRYGGRLEKFIGDAAVAVFGVPRSRDDDAARAVRAGLALVSGVQQIGAALGLDDGTLQVRVGVNTGEAVISVGGEDEGRVTGDTVNTAARLQTAAPVDGVLIGEATALAVSDIAELDAPQAIELKGKAEPTHARVARGVRAEPSREEQMGDLNAPTLGREHELEMLRAARERARAGAVERWLIVAPPGVGKSRLLREVASQTNRDDPDALVWRSRARPDAVSPFDPIARLLLDALATGDRNDAQARLAGALQATGATEMRAQVVMDACLSVVWPQTSSSDEDAQPPAEREALFEAWLEGLDALAGTETQVWLIEDVHWAGGDVLAFIDLCGSKRRAEGAAGRLIIATARPSLLEANADWAADSPDAGRHTMQLSVLAPRDARALVSALVGDALPQELVERIAERSDGNCLFIEELLRTWVSVGTLVSTDGGRTLRLAVPTDEIPLPTSVQQIYAAQLDDLPTAARQLARRASVAGRRFPVGALVPLGADADTGLAPLQRRELVMGPLTEPLWGEAFAYRHALLRDAGYASLARAERARLHVRLAKWLEEAAGDRSAEIAEVIATHYSAALESAPSLAAEIDDGLDRDSVRQLAALWYERAGQGTLSLSAHDAARQLFKRAIDMTPEESNLDMARRWEHLGDATAFAADMDEGAAAYQKAIDQYRKAMGRIGAGFDKGSSVMNLGADKMLEKMARLGQLSPEAAQGIAEGVAALRQGAIELQQGKVELQESLGVAQAGLARSSAALGDVYYQQLRFAEARDLADATMSELPDADEASKARLLVARARGAIGAGGYTPEIEADVARAVGLSRSAGDAKTELKAQLALASVQSERGMDDLSAWQTAREAALRAGDWNAAVMASINAAGMSLEDDAAAALPDIEAAHQLAIAHGLTEQVGWTRYVEAEACFASGDWDRAFAAGTQAMDLADENAYLRLNVRVIHVMVPIASVRGDRFTLERAAAFYASLVGKFEFPDSPYSRIVRAAQDVELAAAGLIPAYLPEVAPRIDGFADDPGGPSFSAALDTLVRAWIAAGEVAGAGRAVDAMTEAQPRFLHQVGSLGLGTHELLQGRVGLAAKEAQQAEIHGRAALTHFRASSAPWWIAKAIRLVERAGAANDDLTAEAAAIEKRLGATGPTQ